MMYSDWKSSKRRKIGSLAVGQRVAAIDGAEIIFRPQRVRVLAVVPEIGAKPGDTLLRFAYYGEGVSDYWFDGKWIRQWEALGRPCSDPDYPRYAFCSVDKGERQWWAKIKTKNGLIGWVHMFSSGVDDSAPFDGTSGCS